MKWLFVVLALSTFALNAPEIADRASAIVRISKAWDGRPFHSSGSHVDAVRVCVAENVPDGAPLFLVCRKGEALSATERSLHIGLVFDRPGAVVLYGCLDRWTEDCAALVPEEWKNRIDGDRFRIISVNAPGARVLAIPVFLGTGEGGRIHLNESARSVVRCRREIAGMLPLVVVLVVGWHCFRLPGALLSLLAWSVCLLLCCLAKCAGGWIVAWGCVLPVVVLCASGWSFCKRRRSTLYHEIPDWRAGFASLLFFIFAGLLALSHSLMPPNGLGTVGGKARVLFLHCGFPSGFFSSQTFSTLQPAYPPGAALLRYGMACAGGECGEWLSQLVTVAAGAVLVYVLVRNLDLAAFLFMSAIAFQPMFIKMSAADYPDVIACLFIVVGMGMIRKEGIDRLVGWVLLGGAGFFKNEGLVYAVLIWAIRSMIEVGMSVECNTPVSAMFRRFARNLLFVGVLPLAWHFGVRAIGGAFSDFAPIWNPDFGQGVEAFEYALELSLLKPWTYAFVCPLALAVVGMSLWKGIKTAREISAESGAKSFVSSIVSCMKNRTGFAVLLWFFCVIVFSMIFAASRAPDFVWHLSTSLPRLLWTPAVILGMSLVQYAKHCGEFRLISYRRRASAPSGSAPASASCASFPNPASPSPSPSAKLR